VAVRGEGVWIWDIDLAERPIEMAPEGFSRVMLLSGCSEAMENAFKIARLSEINKKIGGQA